MYIYPNMTLKILRNVPLNSDYDHTIFFPVRSDQLDYFSYKAKYTLNNQQYQRKERGWIQVNINQNDLWDCTYLMYQNSTHYNKWFFAFILNVEYINENVSKINFSIDVIQTWHFDYTLDKCFVEREHTLTDGLYENTIDEGLDLGPEYHVQANQRYFLDCTRVALVEMGRWNPTTGDGGQYEPYAPNVAKNYFTGAHWVGFDLKDATERQILLAHLNDYISHGIEDSIVCMYQYPRFMGSIPLNQADFDDYGYATTDFHLSPNTVQIDGYLPKNKKLFSFPFNYLEVDNGCGDAATYKYEEWSDNYQGHFRIIGTPFGVPKCMCFPIYYNGETNNFENGLVLQIDIQSAWNGDAYQVWLARNQKNQILKTTVGALSVVGGGVAAVLGGIAGQPWAVSAGIGAATSGGKAVLDTAFEKIHKKYETDGIPDPVHGQISNDLLNLQGNLNHYAFRQKTVRQEYAKIIDEYFSRFGYACHRIKVPNRNARQNWTYVKTGGCEITGNIPSDDVVLIKMIYDHGITFWNNGDNIGNYGDFTNPVY